MTATKDRTPEERCTALEAAVAECGELLAQIQQRLDVEEQLERVERGVGQILDVLGVARGSQPVRHAR